MQRTSPLRRLKQLLVERDVSLAQLAAAIGRSESFTDKIASGWKNPSQATIDRIEAFFDTPVWRTADEYRAQFNRCAGSIWLRAGCILEFDDQETAAQLAIECGDAVKRDRRAVTFLRDIEFSITFPRDQDRAPNDQNKNRYDGAPLQPLRT